MILRRMDSDDQELRIDEGTADAGKGCKLDRCLGAGTIRIVEQSAGIIDDPMFRRGRRRPRSESACRQACPRCAYADKDDVI